MSNKGEVSSRNFAAVDSTNVSSEAQAIVDKYLQSQKDLADRAKKKYTDCQSAREWGNNTMQNGKGVSDHFQNSGNMNNNASEWKCRWLGKIQCTGILNENVTKKRMKMTRKDAAYRNLEWKKKEKEND